MIRILAPLAILAAPAVAIAQDAAPQMSLEQRMLARCAAAIAITAEGQANGNTEALAYPDMTERGREFFVRAGARLMDELQLDRDGVSALLSREAQALWDDGTIQKVMPVCVPLLPSD
ncbi:hypothetical protein [Aurantiacibacter aquimixticola]|uniref:Uncharacterized protein n=1 Tax=Aurantiacibacter aquimixticola TaxID=1958945 RepID=A0A419RVI9_9SPHN|nr:hypothetical protein [Aurantiacibacter aquimixticola]RJY09788.1 hypothetical protein D6201_10875 [Aurantiacibacter aquimixticola]